VVRHRATIEYFDLPRDTLEVYREKIAEVTREDVQRVSRSYLHPDRSITLVVGDQKLFDRSLSELGEVEVIPPQ
jgi:predicted Zn-dependent peptidase